MNLSEFPVLELHWWAGNTTAVEFYGEGLKIKPTFSHSFNLNSIQMSKKILKVNRYCVFALKQMFLNN